MNKNKQQVLIIIIELILVIILWIIIHIYTWWKAEAKHKCDAECKVKYLTDDLKIVKELSHEIVYVCWKNTKDPVHCITYLSAVTMAESSWWWNCKRFNCVWMYDGWIWFDSYNSMVIDWTTRYNKYWYKANNTEFFYGTSPNKPAKSRYCMSEYSSWSKWHCPNWRRAAALIIQKIKEQKW